MNKPSDQQVDILIGNVLRAGVLLSSAVTFIGLLLYLVHHYSATPNYHQFHSISGKLRHLRELFPDAFHGDPVAIIQVGVLLLIATPVARVAFLVGAFALEKDRMYVVVSGFVLAVLIYSIVFFK
jgi:uncharacterized membrane protein